jgi:hypothetical protein
MRLWEEGTGPTACQIDALVPIQIFGPRHLSIRLGCKPERPRDTHRYDCQENKKVHGLPPLLVAKRIGLGTPVGAYPLVGSFDSA